MIAASIQKLKIEFADKMLFQDMSFDIHEGDRVALIGANGTGKTSLFKVITGELEASEGGFFISANTKVGYLEQHACQGSVRTVYDEALTAFDYLAELEIKIEELTHILETNHSREMIEKLTAKQEEYQSKGGLTYKSRTASALNGLGFLNEDFQLTCDKLSGGQRSKLSMCKLLLSNADFLLLDEPTNHLDISGTEWLEEFLLCYKGTVLVISHDRYFLDKICTKTVEISNKTSYFAKGNYSAYQKAKAERIEIEERHYENQIEEIKRIQGIIEQQRYFARERNFITAESKSKMLEKKKAQLIVPESKTAVMRMKFELETESGNDVLEIKGLKKSFNDKPLFENVDMQVFKNDRAFIIGANGCGKTTLLRILTRQMSADEGRFTFGTNVRLGYFDQSLESLRGGKTVLDEIWDEHRLFTETTVRNYLALFLFRGDDVYKNVDKLSGGEKAKLCILKLMLSGTNVLLLDEPTNHLDIVSREVLENALCDFKGTIIAVSHDRYFINKLATKIFRLKSDGVEKFDGDYDDYCRVALTAPIEKSVDKSGKVDLYKLRKARESEINKLRGKISRTEEKIDKLDEKITKLNEELTLPEVVADYEKILSHTALIDEATQKQSMLLEEWEEMHARLEALEEEAEGDK